MPNERVFYKLQAAAKIEIRYRQTDKAKTVYPPLLWSGSTIIVSRKLILVASGKIFNARFGHNNKDLCYSEHWWYRLHKCSSTGKFG